MFRKNVTDIFFDLDHTLWDFEKNSALTFGKILNENGLDVVLDDFLEVYAPINLEYWKLYRENRVSKSELRYQRLRRSFDHIGVTVSDEMINILAHQYIQHLSSFTHLIPNTVEVLDYLAPKYKLHIITNGFQEVQEKKLRKGNIHHYFVEVINSETAGVKKPHPQIFEMALKKASVEPENALMVGDNLEADIQGAISVGMKALHFNAHRESEHQVCQMINDLIEIKSIL
ncbi:YjjG family noncanonical pyrimidine nucleotidase [Flagellimonas nanhaiensis]|uniref:Noncanonical pyrimidine nucleotidase, YjjG family n=1 Tax=Flagellimonas nanhaiensis TaxID=2292706 RepID=A0A371JS89_9FLAO|nr:YjjG family noncanonical pyrimidine nucleotidase [Allomuricauda nanhaiensis]RDY60672.1 noncanonical pyrimidine nucleotidase, YjjG family [Allomuricauda nanhaiensis]